MINIKTYIKKTKRKKKIKGGEGQDIDVWKKILIIVVKIILK